MVKCKGCKGLLVLGCGTCCFLMYVMCYNLRNCSFASCLLRSSMLRPRVCTRQGQIKQRRYCNYYELLFTFLFYTLFFFLKFGNCVLRQENDDRKAREAANAGTRKVEQKEHYQGNNTEHRETTQLPAQTPPETLTPPTKLLLHPSPP